MFEEKPTPVPETPATPPMGNEMLPNSFKEFVRKATLGSARKLGDKTAKVRQQRELLKRKEVISALQDIVAIGKIAEEVGLTAIRMTALQLRGALALVVQQAQDEEGLANCAAAGQALCLGDYGWARTDRGRQDASASSRFGAPRPSR
jgi:hypothetical protein